MIRYQNSVASGTPKSRSRIQAFVKPSQLATAEDSYFGLTRHRHHDINYLHHSNESFFCFIRFTSSSPPYLPIVHIVISNAIPTQALSKKSSCNRWLRETAVGVLAFGLGTSSGYLALLSHHILQFAHPLNARNHHIPGAPYHPVHIKSLPG